MNRIYWRRGVAVLATAQLHSTKAELRFCASSNPACSVSEIRDGEDLWQWSRLEIRLNAFRRSTIPQKQFINSSLIRCYFEQTKFRKMSKHFSIYTNKFRKILLYFPIRTNKFHKLYLNAMYHLHFFLPRKFLLAQISFLKVIYMLLFFVPALLTLKIHNLHPTLD